MIFTLFCNSGYLQIPGSQEPGILLSRFSRGMLHRDEQSGKRSGAFDRKDAGWRSNECGADGQYRSTSHSRRTRARAKTPSKIGN